MQFLIIFTLLLFVGAAHAQEKRPWYEFAAAACYAEAKKRTPDPSAIEHKRILVELTSETEARTYVWFPGGRSDWLARCKVEFRANKFHVVVLAIKPHKGAFPADQGIDIAEYEAARKARERAAARAAERLTAASPNNWTNEKARTECTQDLQRDYGDTLSVSGSVGKQPHENDTTLVGLTARDNRTEYMGQQVTVGCIYKQDGSLFTIFFNSKIANWTAPKQLSTTPASRASDGTCDTRACS